MIEIHRTLSIPESELVFSASRGGGPGGQHVNKVSTRITLTFHVLESTSLTDTQRRRILSRLAGRISREGVLRVTSRRHRSQAANRREVRSRFADLLREALRSRRARGVTAIPAAERNRRLEQKRRRARLKQRRAGPAADE